MRLKGRAFVLTRGSLSSAVSQGAEVENKRFRKAYLRVHEMLEHEAESEPIFAAQLCMLEDPMLSESIEAGLEDNASAEEAVRKACEDICGMFAGIDDEYLSARSDDVRDVCARLLRVLAGHDENPFEGIGPNTVIVAEELFPSDTALMDFSLISAFITARGSSTSHLCIIARSKGIPVLVGRDISGISTGDYIDLDIEESGPSAILESIVSVIGKRPVSIYANAASIAEIESAIAAGAQGIGLFRTEFLFMSAVALPSVEEQAEVYASAIAACGDKVLTIRTLDIGGDKSLPYMQLPREDNPFLGLRGTRFCLANPEVFRTQLEALLLAYNNSVAEGIRPKLRIMFPMIDNVEELRACKEMFLSICPSRRLPAGVELGIMLETPAAVFNAEQLAAEAAFFSIGTNDLTQYVMAADRGNPAVSYLYDPVCPAMRRALSMAVSAAHEAGIHVGVCGEAASDPASASILVDLGVDSLSLNGLAVI